MNNYNGKTNQSTNEVIKSIMKREKKSATRLAEEMKISGQAFRKRLRGSSKFSINEFTDILEHLGYKMMIVKKEDLV